MYNEHQGTIHICSLLPSIRYNREHLHALKLTFWTKNENGPYFVRYILSGKKVFFQLTAYVFPALIQEQVTHLKIVLTFLSNFNLEICFMHLSKGA